MSDPIILSPALQSTLRDLSIRMNRSPEYVLELIVEGFKHRIATDQPVTSISGVDPTDVWKAYRQAEAGLLTSHEELFARLRRRS